MLAKVQCVGEAALKNGIKKSKLLCSSDSTYELLCGQLQCMVLRAGPLRRMTGQESTNLKWSVCGRFLGCYG